MLKYYLFLSVVSIVLCGVNVYTHGTDLFSIVLNSNLLKCKHEKNLSLPMENLDLWFYDFTTSSTYKYRLSEAAETILARSDFNKNYRVIIFIHGFKNNIHSKAPKQMKEDISSLPYVYLFMIDHSFYTKPQGRSFDNYEESVKYAYDIAKATSKFLVDLYKGGVSNSRMHVVGHSLGGQIAGYVGTIFNETTGGILIDRITGIDPAGPCFTNAPITDQIRSGVAKYVDVYHCNAGQYGTSSVLADADFFANYEGKLQPECSYSFIKGISESSGIAARCSHQECVKIWSNTARDFTLYKATQCYNYHDLKEARCLRNPTTIAGYNSPYDSRGAYFFKT